MENKNLMWQEHKQILSHMLKDLTLTGLFTDVDNVTYYDKVSLRMSFIGYQAPNVGHILWHAVTLIWHSFDTVQQPAR